MDIKTRKKIERVNNSKLDRDITLKRKPALFSLHEDQSIFSRVGTSVYHYIKTGSKLYRSRFEEDTGRESVADSVRFYYDMKVCNFGASSGTVFMLPLLSYAEKTSFTGNNEYVSIVAPYKGFLVRAAFRSEEAQNGNLIFKLYGSTTGTEIPGSVRATKTTAINIADDTSVIVNLDSGLDSGSNAMVKGDIFGVEITVPSAPGDCNVTLTFKWDINS